MQTQEPLIHTPCRISTLFAAAFPASLSVSQGSAEDFKMTQEALSFLRSPALPPLKDHLFCCLKMFPVCCRMTKAGLLRPSSVRWMSWGTMSHGKSLTARISVSPNPESACILSDILESDVPEKYYLSQTQIASDLKLSPSTVRRGICDLKKAGLLETEQRYRKKGGKSSLLFKIRSG